MFALACSLHLSNASVSRVNEAQAFYLYVSNGDLLSQAKVSNVDDLNLPFGTIRIRKQGSNGGHNGLGNIQSVLGTENYARVRFGIGNEYTRGAQIGFVLGEWTDDEKKTIEERLKVTTEIIPSFCLQGIDRTMNLFNHK